jgi:tetratricopeptide (TPR) repeat protein
MAATAACWGQPNAGAAQTPDRSTAYYNYTLAHMYANLAAESPNRTEYIQEALKNYKAAIQADPESTVLPEELSEFYIQFNLLREARQEADEALRKNPNNLAAHRLLARIYLRELGENQGRRLDPNVLARAVEEYEIVTQLAPKDVESWIMLGRLQRARQNQMGAERAFEKALEVQPDNEDALVGLAAVYLDRNDSEGAAELFRRAAEKNPSAASWQRLAGTYEQLREYKLAAETIRKALRFNPPNAPELRRALAQDLLNAGEYTEAAEAYRAVAEDDPTDAQPHLRMSQIYLQTGELAKAREEADKAKQISPSDNEVRFHEVTLLQAEGRPREAIQNLKVLLSATERRTYTTQQRASRMALLERLALLHRTIEQPEEAVSAYRQVIELDNTTAARVTAEIIDTYRGGKKFADAQRESDAAIKKWPNDRIVRLARASLEADMGRVDNATNDIKKLLDGRDDRNVHLALAELYEKGRKFKEAAESLDAAEKLSTEENEKITVWFMRGAMYEKMKNLPLAEAEFRKVLAVMPDHAATLNYLGYMLTDRNVRVPEALEMIQRALKIEPNNGAYLDSLGWAYFRLGRFAEAEEQIRRAVELSPGDPTMHDHFAEALMQQSKVREAVKAWEESLRQWQASAPADRDTAEIEKVRTKLEQARARLAREPQQ